MFFEKLVTQFYHLDHTVDDLDGAMRRMDEIQKSLLGELGFEERYQRGTRAGFTIRKKENK